MESTPTPFSLSHLRAELRAAILGCALRHGAQDVRVIGSVARGEATAESDLDLLVRMEPGRSLFDLIGFELELRNLLDVEVDIISEGGIHPLLREAVYRDAVPL